jgi:hypothetical protein
LDIETPDRPKQHRVMRTCDGHKRGCGNGLILRLSRLAVLYVFLLGFTEDGDRLAPAMVLALSGLQHTAAMTSKFAI